MENIFKLLWGDDDSETWKIRDVGKSMRRQRSSKIPEGYELDEVDNLNPERLKRFRSVSVASTIVHRRICNWQRVLEHIFASMLCVAALYSILIIMSECVGCLVEILVFTMMGVIVNAGTLLKYIALVILVVVYSYDCFNNVEKRYLKLNKALFNEVKGRIKDLEKVTSLPSYLQENRGFKSQELSEQAEYEMPDEIVEKPARHWLINDLVLFIDNEDMPRIPRKLFEDVCEIRVAGVPGPVYLGLLFALQQFLKIAVFVAFIFLVILSFGNVYGLSSTNQMIAALAGGSLPLILRTFMEPEKPDIEMGTVSFKSKLDEIIKNFAQYWPIYDFSFDLHTQTEEEIANKEESEKNAENDKEENERTGKNVKEEINFNTANGGTDETDNSSGLFLMDRDLKSNGVPLTNTHRHALDSLRRPTTEGKTIKLEKQGRKEVDHPDGTTKGKVCFEEVPPQREVDILITLPNRYDEIWLDEWSDFGNETISEKNDDVFDH